MKKSFIIITCFMLAIGAQSVKAEDEKTSNFKLTVFTSVTKPETALDERHPLCNSLNSSWNMFHANFRRISKISTGFSGRAVEIHKPAIYNAVVNTEKHIRKEVKKGNIKHEDAIAMLVHILDCANALAMEHDTKAFENEIKSAKKPESIILFFSQIEIEYI